MVISSVMTKNPIVGRSSMSVNEAREIMIREKIGTLPILDKNEELIGILTKKDLLRAGPSAATTLDMYEISYLLSKMTVEKVMQKNVITVQDSEVVEEAARIMADNQIGCLPVMKGDLLVGIITESDLFRAFISLFGARYQGVRVTFLLEEKPGQLAKLTQAIAEKNGNIVSLITYDGDNSTEKYCTCKITGIAKEAIIGILSSIATKVVDIRE
ncbi:MAG: CBS domain-containing protein [Spirochaetaceae bacterium]|nr:CBS domain-containing protein [Spirochaetaceae bacterium]